MKLAFVGFLPPTSANPEERTFVELLSAHLDRCVFFQGIGIKGLTLRSLRALPRRFSANHLPNPHWKAAETVGRGILPILPIRSGPAARISAGMIRQSLIRITNGDFASWVFWTRFPSPELIWGIRGLAFRKVVYEAVDNYAAEPTFTTTERRRLEDAERELLSRATVITTSKRLAMRFEGAGAEVHWLPIGYDDELKAARSEAAERVPRPRLAVVGSLDELADECILYVVASSRPQWQLLLAGPREPGWGKSLDRLPNVHWLGALSPAQARGVTAACDVALNPCVLNSWTEHAFPVKIFDYLAEGRPVVSTPMAELDLFGDLVVQVSQGQFVSAIERALSADSPGSVGRRIEIARQFTLQERARRAFELVSEGRVEVLSQRPA
jgi:glycosyltransferase involved in cell wall biosynthesis